MAISDVLAAVQFVGTHLKDGDTVCPLEGCV